MVDSSAAKVNLIDQNVYSLMSDNHRIRIDNWLILADPSTNYKDVKTKRHPRTGDWLIASDTFVEWASGTPQYLWLYGLAGCGKTILSSRILDYLHLNQVDNEITLQFFFSFSGADK